MEEIVHCYQRLVQLLEEEEWSASQCFQGEALEAYRKVLRTEREEVERAIEQIKP